MNIDGKISIHALREEGDMPLTVFSPAQRDFYPRPPRGGRLQTSLCHRITSRFLSTPSARRATLCYLMDGRWTDISIHALREEGDAGRNNRPAAPSDISIHALREEGD